MLKRGGKNTQKNQKGLNDLDNHEGVITHQEPGVIRGGGLFPIQAALSFASSVPAANGTRDLNTCARAALPVAAGRRNYPEECQ